MTGRAVAELATVVRSKNAGPFELTLDVVWRPEWYAVVRDSGLVTAAWVAAQYRLPVSDVLAIHWFDAAGAVKVNLRRRVPAGDVGDTDVYGAQQQAPLAQAVLLLPERPTGG